MVYNKRNRTSDKMVDTKLYRDKKTGKIMSHFAFITEELTEVINKLEARQKYLETGFDKIWMEVSNRTCFLAKNLDKMCEQQIKILEIIELLEKKHQLQQRKKRWTRKD